MKNEQVITIDLDGSMESLRQKKGEGVDLRTFGVAVMERVSEIVLDEKTQKYKVHLLTAPFNGRDMTNYLYGIVMYCDFSLKTAFAPKLYDEYEDAVAGEIGFLNAVRKQGRGFSAEHLDQIAPKDVA